MSHSTAASSSSSSSHPDYSKMKVPQLKELCRTRGLKVSGAKAELIDRLEGRELPSSSSRKRKAGEESADNGNAAFDMSFVDQVDPTDMHALKLGPIRKALKAEVRSFHKLVNDDWHDGWEEQMEDISEFVDETIKPIIQSVINILNKGVGHQYCHEVLIAVADWWGEVNAVDVRFNYGELNFGMKIDDVELSEMINILQYSWDYILLGAIEHNIDRPVINQMIADAVAFEWEDDNIKEREVPKHLKAHIPALKQIVGADEWKQCHSRKVSYKSKPVIDRRFDGPKHLRTRSFSDSDDSDDGGHFGYPFF